MGVGAGARCTVPHRAKPCKAHEKFWGTPADAGQLEETPSPSGAVSQVHRLVAKPENKKAQVNSSLGLASGGEGVRHF